MRDENTITGTGVPVREDGIGSDQILPAEVSGPDDIFRGGEGTDSDGRFENASVLVVDRAFGNGESRPALVEALAGAGIEAVVGESFGADFLADCRAAGIAAVTASGGDVRTVQEWVLDNPDGKLKVDVDDELLVYGVRNHDERDGDTYQPGFAATEFVPVQTE